MPKSVENSPSTFDEIDQERVRLHPHTHVSDTHFFQAGQRSTARSALGRAVIVQDGLHDQAAETQVDAFDVNETRATSWDEIVQALQGYNHVHVITSVNDLKRVHGQA